MVISKAISFREIRSIFGNFICFGGMLILFFLPAFLHDSPTLYVVNPLPLIYEQVMKKYPEGTPVPKDEYIKISRDVCDAINKMGDQTGYEFVDKGGLAIARALGGPYMAFKKIIYCDDLVR